MKIIFAIFAFLLIYPLCAESGEYALKGIGTGFFISDNGTFIANDHVVGGCGYVVAYDSDRVAHLTKTIKSDPDYDLAVLTYEVPRKTTPLPLRVSPAPVVGETASEFGFPLPTMISKWGTFSTGIVMSENGFRDDEKGIVVSTPTMPGNSGGAVADSAGNVIGVITAVLNTEHVQSTNFAIKSSVLAKFLKKNNVPFNIGTQTAAIDLPALAARLKKSSAVLICMGEAGSK